MQYAHHGFLSITKMNVVVQLHILLLASHNYSQKNEAADIVTRKIIQLIYYFNSISM
jgi:hypothetical protein